MRRQRELGLPTRVVSVAPHPVSGLVMISLDKVDPDCAPNSKPEPTGLAFVAPHPDTGLNLAPTPTPTTAS